MNLWPLQNAKAQLSKLIKQAAIKPQHISVHGEPKVVVLSQKDYERLTKAKSSFVKFLRHSPLMGVSLKIVRDQSKTRDIEL